MKVDIKTKAEIDKMRVACRMSAEVRDLAAAAAVPGATTLPLNCFIAHCPLS